jgi:LuxR family maltose regulon positive regulatory protein
VILNLGLLYLEARDWDAAQAAYAEAFETALKSEENLSVAVSAQSLQGAVHIATGELEEAIGCYHIALELGSTGAYESRPILATCTAHLGLAEVYRQRNDIAAAWEHLNQGWELAQETASQEMIADIYYLSRVHLGLAAGDLEQAKISLDRLDALPNIPKDELFDSQVAAARGALFLAQGDVDAMARLVAARDLQQDRLTITRLPEYVLMVRIMLAENQYDQALQLARDTATAAENCRYATVGIEATILQALAHHHKGNAVQALACLEDALDIAAPQGYVHPFLSVGEPVDKLLRQAIARSIHGEHARRILAASAARARKTATPLPPDGEIPPFVEPLTERELQVLRLLATGLSSTETAEELVIAVSTVRSYIKVIYRKLDVHSRAEALERARQLNLL